MFKIAAEPVVKPSEIILFATRETWLSAVEFLLDQKQAIIARKIVAELNKSNDSVPRLRLNRIEASRLYEVLAVSG